MKIKEHNTAGCFLVRKSGDSWEIVLIYKKWAEDNQGWGPPKGHVESRETLEEAARRETTEETRYSNIKIIRKLETLHLEYPWDDGYIHKKSIHYFLAFLLDDQRKNLKQNKYEENSTVKVEWMNLREAEKVLLFADERQILGKVVEILSSQIYSLFLLDHDIS